ncbi:hypothetical protein AB1Y20_014327 [Prymnesium parvum]|uniref:Uncharacterized protein n=1 Tax=Prymnesium parvum TaxID=97485 RepID=A0AB34IGW5_PRYPA
MSRQPWPSDRHSAGAAAGPAHARRMSAPRGEGGGGVTTGGAEPCEEAVRCGTTGGGTAGGGRKSCSCRSGKGGEVVEAEAAVEV